MLLKTHPVEELIHFKCVPVGVVSERRISLGVIFEASSCSTVRLKGFEAQTPQQRLLIQAKWTRAVKAAVDGHRRVVKGKGRRRLSRVVNQDWYNPSAHTVKRALLVMELLSRRSTHALLSIKRHCQLRLQWVVRHGYLKKWCDE
ncbi:hypothetical protein TNCV_3731991 [Trichonephila clavipes]|nr:hypothetical protein TNCV_3731991 [Trichonephila clavipes]